VEDRAVKQVYYVIEEQTARAIQRWFQEQFVVVEIEKTLPGWRCTTEADDTVIHFPQLCAAFVAGRLSTVR
jgi:hypothetical protein